MTVERILRVVFLDAERPSPVSAISVVWIFHLLE